MAKTAVINARIDPVVKERAEGILSELGISASGAITIFYTQVVLHGGLPFAVALPPNDVRTMSAAQLDNELALGYSDAVSGNVKDAEEVFSNILGADAR